MRFLRPLLGLLILVGTVGAGPPAPPGAADAARTRQDPIFPDLGELGLDVRHYDVGLTVDRPGTPELRGVVTLTLGSTRPLGQVQLDFLGPHVTATRWNGQDVPFRVDGAAGKLTVTPPAPLVPGQTARLTVEYRGTPGTVLDPGFSTPLRLGWQTVPPVGNRAGANFTLSEPLRAGGVSRSGAGRAAVRAA